MPDRRPFPPRRLQRMLEQQRRQQFQQQRYEQQPEPPSPAPLPGLPGVPRNLADLKQLLQVYGPLLSPENRDLIAELVSRLEGGGDLASLQELAARMQQAALEQRGGE